MKIVRTNFNKLFLNLWLKIIKKNKIIMKYIAAYFVKNPKPIDVPSNIGQIILLLSNVLSRVNKLMHQNSNKGVSVDIIRLPKLVKGNVAHINVIKFATFIL